jgi:hypothetical protein
MWGLYNARVIIPVIGFRFLVNKTLGLAKDSRVFSLLTVFAGGGGVRWPFCQRYYTAVRIAGADDS